MQTQSIVSLSNPSLANEDLKKQCSPRDTVPYFLFSIAWVGTAGLVLGEALRGGVGPIRFVPVMLLVNWWLFPFSLPELPADQEMILKKIYQIGRRELGEILVFTAAVFIDLYIMHNYTFSKSTQVSILVALLALNLLSCERLRNHPRGFRGSEYISTAVDWFVDFGKGIIFRCLNGKNKEKPYQEGIRNGLIEDIEEAREINRLTSSQINAVIGYIESDNDLLNAFNHSKNETQDILLPLPVKDQAQPLNDPLIEAWRQEKQTKLYLDSMKVRVNDFLMKNPNFRDHLIAKLLEDQQRQPIDWVQQKGI